MNHNEKNGTNPALLGLRIALPVLQLILSAAFVYFVWQTQLIPDRYVNTSAYRECNIIKVAVIPADIINIVLRAIELYAFYSYKLVIYKI